MSILDTIATQWLLDHTKMIGLAGIIERWSAGEKLSAATIADVVNGRDEARAASRPRDSVLSSKSPADQRAGFYMVGNVAVVPIEGVLAARAGMVNNVSSAPGMSADEVIRSVTNAAKAAADAKGAVVLHMDSPGGTVAGTNDMADAIRLAGAQVPVIALANNQACSGCYWLASQAHGIMASPLAIVGSIGVMQAIADTSRAAENAGVKVHVVKRGENKGIGVNGTPVTEAQLAVLQRQLDVMYESFVAAIADGRGLSIEAATALADGASHSVSADNSQNNPLIKSRMIDRVGNLNDAVAWAAELAHTRTYRGPKRNSAMNLEQLKAQHPTLVDQIRAEAVAAAKVEHDAATKSAVEAAKAEAVKAEREKAPEPASIDQLEKIVPTAMDGRDGLILAMVKSKATPVQAQEQVTAKLAEQNAKLAKDLAAEKKVNEGLGKNGLATDPLKFKPGNEGGEQKAFEQVVLAIAARDKCTILEATGKASNDPANKEARLDWVARKCPDIKAA